MAKPELELILLNCFQTLSCLCSLAQVRGWLWKAWVLKTRFQVEWRKLDMLTQISIFLSFCWCPLTFKLYFPVREYRFSKEAHLTISNRWLGVCCLARGVEGHCFSPSCVWTPCVRYGEPRGAGAGGARVQDAVPPGLPRVPPWIDESVLEEGPWRKTNVWVYPVLPGRLFHCYRATVPARRKFIIQEAYFICTDLPKL